MRKLMLTVAAAALMGNAIAADMASPDEAMAMSQKAQAAVNEMGSEAAVAAFAATSYP